MNSRSAIMPYEPWLKTQTYLWCYLVDKCKKREFLSIIHFFVCHYLYDIMVYGRNVSNLHEYFIYPLFCLASTPKIILPFLICGSVHRLPVYIFSPEIMCQGKLSVLNVVSDCKLTNLSKFVPTLLCMVNLLTYGLFRTDIYTWTEKKNNQNNRT